MEKLDTYPIFKRVILKVPKEREEKRETAFWEKPDLKDDTAIFLSFSIDCDKQILELDYGAEVYWNGNINKVIEETDEYQIVITHETNILGVKFGNVENIS